VALDKCNVSSIAAMAAMTANESCCSLRVKRLERTFQFTKTIKYLTEKKNTHWQPEMMLKHF
jgi:hypothetical protein